MFNKPRLYLARTETSDRKETTYIVRTPDLGHSNVCQEWEAVAEIVLREDCPVYEFRPQKAWLDWGLVHPMEYAFGPAHVSGLLNSDAPSASNRYALLIHLYAEELLKSRERPERYPQDYSPTTAIIRTMTWFANTGLAETTIPATARDIA